MAAEKNGRCFDPPPIDIRGECGDIESRNIQIAFSVTFFIDRKKPYKNFMPALLLAMSRSRW